MTFNTIRSTIDQLISPLIEQVNHGYTISVATDPNPNSHYNEDGTPVNHDAVLVADISDIPSGHYARIAHEALINAHNAIINLPSVFIPSPELCPRNPKDVPHTITSTKGGTTATLALYDPATFEVKIGSKGDCPVFVILDDGHHTAAVKISSSADSYKANITSCLNDPESEEHPVRQAEYTIGTKHFEGPVNLHELVDAAKKEYGLGNPELSYPEDRIKVNLLIASDGIMKPLPDDGLPPRNEEVKIAARYRLAQHSGFTNKAQAMTEYAIEKGSTDNLSAIMLEDIAPGKGKPVAVAICDGFYNHGHVVAQTAIRNIGQYLQREKEQACVQEEYVPSERPSLSRTIEGWRRRLSPDIQTSGPAAASL